MNKISDKILAFFETVGKKLLSLKKKKREQGILTLFSEFVAQKNYLRIPLMIAVIIANSALLLYAIQYLSLLDHEKTSDWFSAHFAVAAFTFIILAIALFLLHNLCGRIIMSMAILDAPLLSLAVVSYFKVKVNGEPLSAQDFGMAGNLGELGEMTSGTLGLTEHILFGIVILVILFILVWPLGLALKQKSHFRLISFTASAVALIMLLSPSVTNDTFVTMGFDTEVRKNQSAVNNESGFLMGLYRSAVTKTDEPDGYSEEYMNAIFDKIVGYSNESKAVQLDETAENPNVILILSESLFDITTLPNVTFSEDPTPFIRSLCDSGDTIHGRFFTRQCGFGTGNVEIEVLTGLSGRTFPFSYALSYDLSPSDFKKITAVPAAFKNAGYHTAAIHTYGNTLYNRTENFPALGFDKVLFNSDLQPKYGSDFSSQYVLSDDFLSKQIINEFESANDNGPSFIYGISMENHQPYAKRYGELNIDVSSSVLSSTDLELLATYARGAGGVDLSIATLVDYFSNVSEPTIIAVYGDHLPSLPTEDGSTIYEKLGIIDTNNRAYWTAEQCDFMFSTEYFIWSNYSLPAEGDDVKNSSSNTLGRELIELAGLNETYYDVFMRMYSENVGFWSDYSFTDIDGTVTVNIPDNKKEITDDYYAICYDTYFGKGYITDRLNMRVGDKTGDEE